jgi:hypothetical protein
VFTPQLANHRLHQHRSLMRARERATRPIRQPRQTQGRIPRPPAASTHPAPQRARPRANIRPAGRSPAATNPSRSAAAPAGAAPPSDAAPSKTPSIESTHPRRSVESLRTPLERAPSSMYRDRTHTERTSVARTFSTRIKARRTRRATGQGSSYKPADRTTLPAGRGSVTPVHRFTHFPPLIVQPEDQCGEGKSENDEPGATSGRCCKTNTRGQRRA